MAQLLTDEFAFPENLALFLDFDGTLVGFQDDPELVKLQDEETASLIAINKVLNGALAIISGRDLRDLSKRVPTEFWRLGNHGLYIAPPHEAPAERFASFPDGLDEEVTAAIDHVKDVWLETKGPIFAVHHRANPHAGSDIERALTPIIAAMDDYMLQVGNNVIEIKPRQANKGSALTQQMHRMPFKGRLPVMIGDDTTDEDGFLAAQALGGYGIKMGYGETSARYRIADTRQLYKILGQIK